MTTRRFADVGVGDVIGPELTVELTPTRVIAAAIASRDYQEVHHDRDLAVQRGSKDIFMNILSTNGFVGRFVTDWAGPDARLRAISIRLGVPNYAYDTMRMTGSVVAVHEASSTVEVEVRGANSLGDHVTGRVIVELPR